MDTQHRLLPCLQGSCVACPPGFTFLLEGKEEFGGGYVPHCYFIWVDIELLVASNGHLKGLQGGGRLRSLCHSGVGKQHRY